MRVALVCPYDLGVPGGVQSHVLQLAAALRTGGDEVVVFGPGTPGEVPEGVVPVGRGRRVRFNASVAPIAVSPLSARRVVELIRRFRPDVVHVHEPVVPFVSLAATLRCPPPVVGTFHAWSDSGRVYRFARPIVRRAVTRLAARIAVSGPAIAYHAAALGLPAGSFRELPNGVEVERFASASPLDELTADGAPLLLFVGRLEPRKGVEQLVRAFTLLSARRPSVKLLVAGDGPERDRAQRLLPGKVRSRVVFLGRVDHDELPRFYASADVFVAPSLGGESFGVVLLEAMAAGVPIVASDIPGYRAVLHDGVEGRFTAPGDVSDLAAALDVLLDNPALRAAMGREGRHTASSYDWSVVAARVRDVYAHAVGSRPAGEGS